MDAEGMPRTFRTFIFDLDGTLLDTVPDLVLLTNRILAEVGAPERTKDEILSFVGSGVRRLIYLALPEDASEETREEAMALWNKWFHEYYHNTVPFPGIAEMLDKLEEKGCKLGVVSNKLQAGVDLIMQLCLPDRFAVMLGDSPMIPRKPDPTGILQAMRVLGATPEEMVYVGDSPGDIVAAHNAGVFAVAVLWGYHKLEDFDTEGPGKPDLVIATPEELVTLAS